MTSLLRALRQRSVAGVAFMLSTLSAGLSGCIVGTPWPRITRSPDDLARQPVVLVLTRVVVDSANRGEFDRQNRRVLASMATHPGLIGFAARREVFGNRGWTMSVWADDEARVRFVGSAVHSEAMVQSRPSLRSVETRRLTLARQDLPQSWVQALALLAQPDRLRNYREQDRA